MLRCDCGSTNVRLLNCDDCREKEIDCNLIICCDCGDTVYEITDEKLEQALVKVLTNGA